MDQFTKSIRRICNAENNIEQLINALGDSQKKQLEEIINKFRCGDTSDCIHDYFYQYTMNNHLKDKIKSANAGKSLELLYNLTMRLWNEHKIILLNDFGCSGSDSWHEARDVYGEHRNKGVKGVIAWWDYNCNRNCIVGIWEDNVDVHDDVEAKRINLKNLSKYVVPIMADLEIEYTVENWQNNIKWLYIYPNLDFIMPNDLCAKCF